VGYTSHPGAAARGGMYVTNTAMGVLARQFMGFKRSDPNCIGGAEYMVEYLPRWDTSARGNGGHWPFYYWYYGTLVMFQMGGKYWSAWNPAMRDMLIAKQRRGGDEDGSWDCCGPEDSGEGHYTGRVYRTALGALCLEVYYRYLPMYSK